MVLSWVFAVVVVFFLEFVGLSLILLRSIVFPWIWLDLFGFCNIGSVISWDFKVSFFFNLLN